MTDPLLVLRPRVARWVPEILGALVLCGAVLLAVALPSHWDLLNRGGIVLSGVFVYLVLHRLASVRILADDEGLLVINPRLRRRFDYAEIVGVSLQPAAPWLVLDLSDGSTFSAMGVQGSEGAYAQAQVEALRRVLDQHAPSS